MKNNINDNLSIDIDQEIDDYCFQNQSKNVNQTVTDTIPTDSQHLADTECDQIINKNQNNTIDSSQSSSSSKSTQSIKSVKSQRNEEQKEEQFIFKSQKLELNSVCSSHYTDQSFDWEPNEVVTPTISQYSSTSSKTSQISEKTKIDASTKTNSTTGAKRKQKQLQKQALNRRMSESSTEKAVFDTDGVMRSFQDKDQILPYMVQSSKLLLNGVHEAARREDSSNIQRYVQFGNATIQLQDKYTEEITIQVDKPIQPNYNAITTIYKIGSEDERSKQRELEAMGQNKRLKYEKREEEKQWQTIKNFYLKKKGVTENVAEILASMGVTDEEDMWWHIQKKRPFTDVIDDYKWPLTKLMSVEQITAMRKMINSKECGPTQKAKDLKSDKNFSSNKKEEKGKEAAIAARPRRNAAKIASIQMDLQSRNFDDTTTDIKGLQDGNTNMHTLVEPQQYFKETDQPFMLFVTFETLILMNIHAAMHRNEVIGFISGYRTRSRGPTKKDVIIITDCNPCHSAQFTDENDGANVDYSRNVEMDPESAQLTLKKIESKGQSILGWYHSHPKFEVNPSHIDVVNHEMYQKMFNEAGNHFVGLIISPYYSINSDGNMNKYGSLPKLRCFVTVQHGRPGDAKIIAYELQINILPQRTILSRMLLQDITNLKCNPNATDKVQLNNQTTVLKGKKGSQVFLKKGERLMRSLRQLMELNYAKLVSKIGTGSVVKHIECIITAKDREEGESLLAIQMESIRQDNLQLQPKTLKAQELVETPKEKEEDPDDIDAIFASMNQAPKVELKSIKNNQEEEKKNIQLQESKSPPIESEEGVTGENSPKSKSKRKRGRPTLYEQNLRKVQKTVVEVAHKPDHRRVLQTQKALRQKEIPCTLKQPVFATYDQIHNNIRSAITQNQGQNQNLSQEFDPSEDINILRKDEYRIDKNGAYDRFLTKIKDLLEIEDDTYFSDDE